MGDARIIKLLSEKEIFYRLQKRMGVKIRYLEK